MDVVGDLLDFIEYEDKEEIVEVDYKLPPEAIQSILETIRNSNTKAVQNSIWATSDDSTYIGDPGPNVSGQITSGTIKGVEGKVFIDEFADISSSDIITTNKNYGLFSPNKQDDIDQFVEATNKFILKAEQANTIITNSPRVREMLSKWNDFVYGELAND